MVCSAAEKGRSGRVSAAQMRDDAFLVAGPCGVRWERAALFHPVRIPVLAEDFVPKRWDGRAPIMDASMYVDVVSHDRLAGAAAVNDACRCQ